MPSMNGFSNLKVYSFNGGTGTVMTIQKDSLVFVNFGAPSLFSEKGEIYWTKSISFFPKYYLYGCEVYSTNANYVSGYHGGSFVPAGALIQKNNFSAGIIFYLYVIELDNDEQNA